MMNKQIELNYVLGMPNINGFIYNTKSFIKALDKYIKENGKVYNELSKYDEDKNSSDNIGLICDYEVKDNIVLLTVEILPSFEFISDLPFSISSTLFGDIYGSEVNNIEIKETHTDLNYDEETKKYYKNLRS
jgi:hypothetical protein